MTLAEKSLYCILKQFKRTKQQLKKNTNTHDIELLIELLRSYPCIWNLKLNVHKDTLKRKLVWNKIKESLVGNFVGNHLM